MIRIFSIVLLILICTVNLPAQDIKVHGGINISDISAVPDGDAKAQAGFQVGVTAEFGQRFYLEPGIFYMRRFTEVMPGTSGFEPDFKVDGFRIPVAFGYYLIDRNDAPVTLRIFGGPSIFRSQV